MAAKPTISDVAERARVSKGSSELRTERQAGGQCGDPRSRPAGRRGTGLHAQRHRQGTGRTTQRHAGPDPDPRPGHAGFRSVLSAVHGRRGVRDRTRPAGPSPCGSSSRTRRRLPTPTSPGSKRVDGVVVADLRVDDPRPSLLTDAGPAVRHPESAGCRRRPARRCVWTTDRASGGAWITLSAWVTAASRMSRVPETTCTPTIVVTSGGA